jgi:hypothetical protein
MDVTGLALTLAGFGVLLIAISYQRHLTRRDISALVHAISGALLFLSGALLLAISINFNAYSRLSDDQPLAELSLEKTENGEFQARLLHLPTGDLQTLNLQGDTWIMQARIAQWQGWPTWLGLNRHIRLQTINSTDKNKRTMANKPYASSYTLSREPQLRLLTWQANYLANLNLLKTNEVASEPMPLKHGLRFHVLVHEGKLIARQLNSPIKRASSSSNHVVSLETFTNEFNRQLENDGQSAETSTNSASTTDTVPTETSPTDTNVVH